MTASINASTTSGVVVASDTSGSIAIQSNGTTIMTVGSTGVTTQVGAPAFSAWANANQVITSGTYTKLQIQTEEFDTNSNYDTTNYRFTPTVAGYYQVSGAMGWYSAGTQSIEFVVVYKNGGAFKNLNYFNLNTSGVINGSTLVYLNGTTDYVELYGYVTSNNTITVQGNQAQTYFQASMVRSA